MPIPLAGAFIPALMAGFSRLMATQGGRWLVSGLAFMGLSIGTQTVVVTPVIDQVISMASNTPASISEYVAYFNFDKVITMITSAYATKMGMGAGRAFLQRRATGA